MAALWTKSESEGDRLAFGFVRFALPVAFGSGAAAVLFLELVLQP